LADTSRSILTGDEAEQPAYVVATRLRRLDSFKGSLREEIGFIDRSEDEIRGFLAALADALVPFPSVRLDEGRASQWNRATKWDGSR
jgi:hypothetical protein